MNAGVHCQMPAQRIGQRGALANQKFTRPMQHGFALLIGTNHIAGRVTGKGIAGNIRQYYPAWLLVVPLPLRNCREQTIRHLRRLLCACCGGMKREEGETLPFSS